MSERARNTAYAFPRASIPSDPVHWAKEWRRIESIEWTWVWLTRVEWEKKARENGGRSSEDLRLKSPTKNPKIHELIVQKTRSLDWCAYWTVRIGDEQTNVARTWADGKKWELCNSSERGMSNGTASYPRAASTGYLSLLLTRMLVNGHVHPAVPGQMHKSSGPQHEHTTKHRLRTTMRCVTPS